MAYNYSKLSGRITEKCGSQSEFAKRMQLSERSVSMKLNNKRYWKQNEISKSCIVLEIPESSIPEYFFAV